MLLVSVRKKANLLIFKKDQLFKLCHSFTTISGFCSMSDQCSSSFPRAQRPPPMMKEPNGLSFFPSPDVLWKTCGKNRKFTLLYIKIEIFFFRQGIIFIYSFDLNKQQCTPYLNYTTLENIIS